MMDTEYRKGRIAVIGAGSVGATIAHVIMARGLSRELILIDIDRRKCEGEVKDLNHGLRFVPSVRLRAGDVADCAGAEIVVITAGAKQKPGQSRLDLAHANVRIFRELIPAIAKVAPSAILLIVSNPVDVLTYAATKWHVGGPRRVFGSGTVLDSSRLVTLLAERLNVWVGNLHAYVVGEHGDSELALWSSAHIGGIPLGKFAVDGRPPLSQDERAAILQQVRSAAGEIIQAKGATNWAIGMATGRILEALHRDERALLTISRRLDDYHGISDVCLSVPTLVDQEGVGAALPVPMSEEEEAALRESARVVKSVCEQMGI